MKYFFGCSLFSLMLFLSPPALSMEGDTYAAIAVSSNPQIYGYVNKQSTKKKAFSGALKQCRAKGKDCKVANWTTRCLALAIGNNDAWGTGWSKKKRGAKTAAIQKCSEFGNSCVVKVAICN